MEIRNSQQNKIWKLDSLSEIKESKLVKSLFPVIDKLIQNTKKSIKVQTANFAPLFFRPQMDALVDISGHDHAAKDYKGKNFQGLNLSGINFNSADLRGANF